MERLRGIAETVSRLIDETAGDYYGNRAGACDNVNAMLAATLDELGYLVRLVRGTVNGDAHTWVRAWTPDGDALNLDLAGAQFGRPVVFVFLPDADPTYHAASQERLGKRIAVYGEDAPIVAAAVAACEARHG